ncbi:Ig-like domain-containing protein, partial [Escherichia coli]|uniref:Ig-like domain-containing protein n=1 Tax=Escherichia coli TaxID=562 RepID=UPI00135E6459|nr:tandem-95 repeat protein [Escherichia coli]
TPAGGFVGTDTFNYTVRDGRCASDAATLSITVNEGGSVPVNSPPNAVNDTITTAEDTQVNVAVLTNDTDPDGDILRVTSATASTVSVTVNPDNTLTYVPATNFNGVATVTYTVSDGRGGTDIATLTVTVTPVN